MNSASAHSSNKADKDSSFSLKKGLVYCAQLTPDGSVAFCSASTDPDALPVFEIWYSSQVDTSQKKDPGPVLENTTKPCVSVCHWSYTKLDWSDEDPVSLMEKGFGDRSPLLKSDLHCQNV